MSLFGYCEEVDLINIRSLVESGVVDITVKDNYL
jgi:hypothetical protein